MKLIGYRSQKRKRTFCLLQNILLTVGIIEYFKHLALNIAVPKDMITVLLKIKEVRTL